MQETHLSKYISGIYRLTKGILNGRISHFDVRATQSDLLLFIGDNPNLSQIEISKANSVDPSLLARDLRLLEQRGWLVRVPSPVDGRTHLVQLTQKGRQLAHELKIQHEQWWRDFSQRNPQIDLETFSSLLGDVYDALAQETHGEGLNNGNSKENNDENGD